MPSSIPGWQKAVCNVLISPAMGARFAQLLITLEAEGQCQGNTGLNQYFIYVVEGPANGYTSIPVAIYWAISTMTTVGFGDIVPKTGFGRFIASVMMLLGWGILAVPTGIVTAEMTSRRMMESAAARACPGCGSHDHAPRARHCQHCGAALPAETP